MSEIGLYDHDADFEAVLRMWREISWLDDSEIKRQALTTFLQTGTTRVARINGEAESMAQWAPAQVRYVDRDLPLCIVTAVATSHTGRKQGFASRLTAQSVADGAASGMAVACLGMFEQGFYDRLGFGTGSYEHTLTFDPGNLIVDVPYRTPIRLTADGWADAAQALKTRHRTHGGVVLNDPRVLQAEMRFTEKPFGLGYRDQTGRLTHFIYGSAKDEHGPYEVLWMAYENHQQLLELLRLLRELADQVATVELVEPPGIRLQDLIRQPIRDRIRTKKSDHEVRHRVLAWWQVRILDLGACIAVRTWHGPELTFNVTLTDPISGADDSWPGIGGDYTVTIGESSHVVDGHGSDLPTLQASVNAFSRLWFGVHSATGLAVTDDLEGPSVLLERLDEVFDLPEPRLGMYI